MTKSAEHFRLITVKKKIKTHQSVVLKIAVTSKQYHLNQLKSNKTLNNIFFCGETSFPHVNKFTQKREIKCAVLSAPPSTTLPSPFTVCSCHHCSGDGKSMSNIRPFLSASSSSPQNALRRAVKRQLRNPPECSEKLLGKR